jgi:hypothetical protein
LGAIPASAPGRRTPGPSSVYPPAPWAAPVSELTELLRDAARRLEPEIARRLKGMLGGIIRAYLPQAWEFRTDEGTATLTVKADGSTAATEGGTDHPDVTIEIPLAALKRALATGERDPSASGSVHVTPHTAKGRAAFDYLRSRIGL